MDQLKTFFKSTNTHLKDIFFDKKYLLKFSNEYLATMAMDVTLVL